MTNGSYSAFIVNDSRTIKEASLVFVDPFFLLIAESHRCYSYSNKKVLGMYSGYMKLDIENEI